MAMKLTQTFHNICEKKLVHIRVFRQDNEQYKNIIREASNQRVFMPNIFLELIINCMTFQLYYILQTLIVVFD